MSSLKETIVAAIILIALASLVNWIAGCASTKEAIAEATYLGQQLECVDNLETKQDIDGCRASVRKRWGIVETVAKDAGHDR